ncbi:MAG: AAA family ATPase [Planktothrix rubescens PR222]
MSNWQNFLILEVSRQYGLSRTETAILVAKFPEINTVITNKEVADLSSEENQLPDDPENVRRQMWTIYNKKFCQTGDREEFPNYRDRSSKNKDLQLLTWLKPKYQSWLKMTNSDSDISNFNQSINNYQSNPFVPIAGIIDESHLFFGRTQEIKRIFETLNSGSSVAIIGERQIGKSSLLMEISRQAQTQLLQPREPIYLNLQDIHDDDDFYQFLCDYAGIDFCKGYRLSRNLQNHRLLLILDELEKMTWEGFTNNIRGQLRGLAEGMNAPLRLIVAACTSLDQLFPDSQDIGMTSPFTGICIEYKLNRWDEQTIRDFIASRLNSPLLKPEHKTIIFTEDEISELINRSEGHPQKLMALCNQTFKCYLEKLS